MWLLKDVAHVLQELTSLTLTLPSALTVTLELILKRLLLTALCARLGVSKKIRVRTDACLAWLVPYRAGVLKFVKIVT